MPNDEKAAKKYLEGLNTSDAPWLTPIGGSKPAARPAAKPSPKPAPRSTGDDAKDQYDELVRRNADIAKRTRHLRRD